MELPTNFVDTNVQLTWNFLLRAFVNLLRVLPIAQVGSILRCALHIFMHCSSPLLAAVGCYLYRGPRRLSIKHLMAEPFPTQYLSINHNLPQRVPFLTAHFKSSYSTLNATTLHSKIFLATLNLSFDPLHLFIHIVDYHAFIKYEVVPPWSSSCSLPVDSKNRYSFFHFFPSAEITSSIPLLCGRASIHDPW